MSDYFSEHRQREMRAVENYPPSKQRDPDADIKLDGPPLQRRHQEHCTVCGIRDGRELPDSWRGKPMCKPCGDVIQLVVEYTMIRCVDVALNAVLNTGRSISTALHQMENA
jgi:hypothetical protein